MSVTTVDREVTVVKPVRIYRCDGPACSKTIEAPMSLKVMEVPAGWVMLRNMVELTPPAMDSTQHFCSSACTVAYLNTGATP